MHAVNMINPTGQYAWAGGASISGVAYDLAVVDHYAYVTSDDGLHVLDLSPAWQPDEIAHYEDDKFLDILAYGNYLFVQQQIGGDAYHYGRYRLVIFDITDIENPVEVAEYRVPSKIIEMRILDEYLYYSHDRGLRVLDISDPENPFLTGFYNTRGRLLHFDVQDHRVIASEEYFFEIFEFDPETAIYEQQQSPFPDRFHIERVYPNPFNSIVNITVLLDHPLVLNARLFDILGRQVAEMKPETVQAGEKTFSWHLNELPSGVYFLRMETDRGEQAIKKLVLMK
jgi:hypothetical protein